MNASRAGLIARGVLFDALNLGRPGMAAIDVFDTEPMTDASDPPLSHPNLTCTPHDGFATEDAFGPQFTDILGEVNAYATGERIHVIDPEVQIASGGTRPQSACPGSPAGPASGDG